MAEIPEQGREILSKKGFAHVATLMPDGAPQVTPVWVEEQDGDVLINTAEGRLKTDNLRHDDRVALSVTDPDDPYQALLVRGRVAEMTHEGADEQIDALSKKYLDEDSYPFRREGEVRVKVRIEPETVSVGGG